MRASAPVPGRSRQRCGTKSGPAAATVVANPASLLLFDVAARARQVLVMAAFPVPRYLAETAAREPGVRDWIAGLPGIVAGLAGRWSLRVGEPFQPGGQCSWTAPAAGPGGADLVLKVGFRFPGGEERDEAAGLRAWAGNGTVRLHATCDSESAALTHLHHGLDANSDPR